LGWPAFVGVFHEFDHASRRLGAEKLGVMPRHCGLMALLNRSVRRRFFSSHYSGVTGIGLLESNPSSSSVSMRSSALRF
jgi:hypothetical protein